MRVDYPELAPLALDAARAYAGIAPASAHAQHLPSYIFTRLGAARSSAAAGDAARARELYGLYGQLLEQCGGAPSDRPELAQAREMVAAR